MAVAATAIWRVRPSGNDLNGAGYDGASYPGGVDYTQQDAPVLSKTDLACTGSPSTTLTSESGGFTSAMVGNAIHITGGTGFNSGWYFITGYSTGKTVTLDSCPASATSAASAGVGRVGGAAYNLYGLSAAIGCNTIYVHGSGSMTPSAADYTYPNGTAVNLQGGSSGQYIHIIGENGRPRIDQGFSTFIQHLHWEGLFFKALQSLGYGFGEAQNCMVVNNVFDIAGFDMNTLGQSSGMIVGNEFFSSVAMASNASNQCFFMRDWGLVANNHFHDIGAGPEISPSGETMFINNVIANCKSDGVRLDGSAYSNGSHIVGNTIANNGGHGIYVGDQSYLNVNYDCFIGGNLIVGHTGTGKSAIYVNNGPGIVSYCDGNQFFGNTINYTGIAAGRTDIVLGSNPFTSPSTEDWSVKAAFLGTGVMPAPLKNSLAGRATMQGWPPGAPVATAQGAGGGTSSIPTVVSTGNYYVG